MKSSLLEVWTSAVRPVMRLWALVPLHIQGKILVILPIAAVVLSSCLALVGNYQRAGIEAAIERHAQMARGFDSVLTLMVNAETGMRGYLLTRRLEFLEPYELATNGLPVVMTEISALVETEPGDGPRLRKRSTVTTLSSLIAQQMTDLEWQRQHAGDHDVSADAITGHLELGKQLMDEIRGNIDVTAADEERLLIERMREINDIRVRDYVAVFLTLGVALGARVVSWYLFSFGVIQQIERLTVNVQSLGQGDSPPFLPSGKRDAIGYLEQAIDDLAERPSAGRLR